MSKHTLSVLVENKPGILARIAALFSRRGFNIDSLAVGVTEHPDISRITIVVGVEELPLEQVTKQLNKLVEVLKIVELDPAQAVQRELVLVKIRADNETRSQIVEIVQLFRAKTVDVSPEAVTIEATGPARSCPPCSRCWSRSASRSWSSPAPSRSAAAPGPSRTARCAPSTGPRKAEYDRVRAAPDHRRPYAETPEPPHRSPAYGGTHHLHT